MIQKIFKNPTLVTTQNNFNIPQINDFSFAKDINAMPIGAQEVAEVSKHYPILFARDAQKNVIPIAILGLESGENLFVKDSGEYKKGYYIPAILRGYPFGITNIENQYSLVVDRIALQKYPSSEVKFFNGNEPSPEAKQIVTFIEKVYADIERTKKALKILLDKELLKPVDIAVQVQDTTYEFKSFFAVDQKAVDQLKDKEIVKLYRNGILSLIIFHLASLSNLQKLGSLKREK